MSVLEKHELPLPFPRIPEAVKARYSISELALRPFGLYESDLNVDFNHTPRPFLVTQILECCTERDAQREKVEQSFFWNLTVGKRIECLLNLAFSGERPEIPVTFLCPNKACGQELEIELSAEEIFSLQEQAYVLEHISIPLEHGQLTLRRPTGSDQREWLKDRFANEETAAHQMLCTLMVAEGEDTVVDHHTTGKLLQVVDQTIDEHDPLVNFSLLAQCPYCEARSTCVIDLESLSLRRLRQAQMRLLASVHCLASNYHWSEQQVFSVPYWRRAYYLSLIEKGKNQ